MVYHQCSKQIIVNKKNSEGKKLLNFLVSKGTDKTLPTYLPGSSNLRDNDWLMASVNARIACSRKTHTGN